MSFRLAAYALCLDDGRVLLVRAVGPNNSAVWTLPGGRVEQGEDPIDTVVREVDEETGMTARVDRLLGVDSRLIPAEEAHAGVEHQNLGIFYLVTPTGRPRPEPNGQTIEPTWVPVAEVSQLVRSTLVDVGLALEQQRPVTGHVDPVPVGGLLQH